MALPPAILQAVTKRFPQWTVPKDVYLVMYQMETGATKTWKLVLKNDDKRLRVKINDKAAFID